MTRGKFITFEGMDGVGKSTHVGLLVEYLRSKGLEVVRTFEPGGTAIADKIRAIIKDSSNKGMDNLTELLLFVAARAEHTQGVILPALDSGKIVVCDRYIDSTVCYQGYGHGMDIDNINYLNRLASKGVVIDLTLWLDLPYGQLKGKGRSRVPISDNQTTFFDSPILDTSRRKGGMDVDDRMEGYENEFYHKMHAGFVAVAKDNERIKRIEASGDRDATFRLIKEQVDLLLQLD